MWGPGPQWHGSSWVLWVPAKINRKSISEGIGAKDLNTYFKNVPGVINTSITDGSSLLWKDRGSIQNFEYNDIQRADLLWLFISLSDKTGMGIFGHDRNFINTLRPRQNGRRFADTFKRIFLYENVRISIKISLKFVPKGPISNIPALVQIMAWRQSGGKPLSEPMMVSLLTHICVTRINESRLVGSLWLIPYCVSSMTPS